MTKKQINSPEFAQPLGSYSHGYTVDVGDSQLIFTTGQIALNAVGEVMHPNDVSKQTEFVFESLQKILVAAGSSLDDVVKATIYLTNIADFSLISPIRNKYFERSKPVSTLVAVTALVKPDCKVEIEVIAVKKKQ